MGESGNYSDGMEQGLAEYLRNVADKVESRTYCNGDAWDDLTHRSPYSDYESGDLNRRTLSTATDRPEGSK